MRLIRASSSTGGFFPNACSSSLRQIPEARIRGRFSCSPDWGRILRIFHMCGFLPLQPTDVENYPRSTTYRCREQSQNDCRMGTSKRMLRALKHHGRIICRPAIKNDTRAILAIRECLAGRWIKWIKVERHQNAEAIYLGKIGWQNLYPLFLSTR